MRIVINGAMGRMGKMLIETVANQGDVVCGLIERPDHPEIGKEVKTPMGGIVLKSLSDFNEDADVGIDFSSPEGAVSFCTHLALKGIPVLCGTTGLNQIQFSTLRDAGNSAPILWTSNTSIGIYCLGEIARMAKKILGQSYDIEIVEVHHRHKKDAPSGTALSIAKQLSEGEMRIIDTRIGNMRGENEIGVASIRGGEVVGEHTILFLGRHDRLEITHRASSRILFAEGAILLARKLVRMPKGFYSVSDLFSDMV